MNFRPIKKSDIDNIKNFTDRWIGEGYYNLEELEEAFELSLFEKETCSFLAENNKTELVGVRLSFAPGKWMEKFPETTSPYYWKVDSQKVAYFKSLFVGEQFQGLGVGRTLSQKSLESLQKMGAVGVVCHSWLESPGNSSQRYLRKMNFQPVKEHPKFWYQVDYLCTRCRPARCECTALEMIKYL